MKQTLTETFVDPYWDLVLALAPGGYLDIIPDDPVYLEKIRQAWYRSLRRTGHTQEFRVRVITGMSGEQVVRLERSKPPAVSTQIQQAEPQTLSPREEQTVGAALEFLHSQDDPFAWVDQICSNQSPRIANVIRTRLLEETQSI